MVLFCREKKLVIRVLYSNHRVELDIVVFCDYWAEVERSWRPKMAGGGRILEGGRFWAGFRVRRGSVLGRISGPEGGSGGGGPPPKNRRNSGVNSGFLRNCADPRVKITPKNPFLSSPRRPAGAPRGSRGPPRRPAGTPRGPPPRTPRGPPRTPPRIRIFWSQTTAPKADLFKELPHEELGGSTVIYEKRLKNKEQKLKNIKKIMQNK